MAEKRSTASNRWHIGTANRRDLSGVRPLSRVRKRAAANLERAQSTRPTISLLVIGTGSAGYRHLGNASTLGVSGISVLTTGMGVSRGVLPKDIRIEGDLGRALDGVNAVVIANPTSLHVRTALEAAKAGCHLLIEKPLSNAIDGVKELASEIRSRNLRAM